MVGLRPRQSLADFQTELDDGSGTTEVGLIVHSCIVTAGTAPKWFYVEEDAVRSEDLGIKGHQHGYGHMHRRCIDLES